MSDNNSGAVNKPNQFGGDKGKSKEFLDELYLYYSGNPKKIQSDKDQIITDTEEPISKSDDTPLQGLPNWAEFKKSFIQTFRDMDKMKDSSNEEGIAKEYIQAIHFGEKDF
ncbi:uncharacterized protein FIBRA_09330 [Fibroporia radiculosa]|uniref:Uncharacterized protein n=1 Tax=Fibroporia radiculosa TaxID=599839 RepID=J7SCA5_9APHY|nr:uncharacterized protein FIBRA_09330 [Fibroporia radiculosa]CCM07011.1 predicted protein [Fibroporia radiculosa]